MPNLIKSNFNEQIAIIPQEQWTTKQCLIGEFSQKEGWFKENWMAVSTPQHGVSETLINKKIIFGGMSSKSL